jgi:5-methylcytosine-specific restriction endonuclease McrA
MAAEPGREASSKVKSQLYARQDGCCKYCGRKLEKRSLRIDRKNSAHSGHRLHNLQLICGPCHTRKGNLTDGEFRSKYSRQAADRRRLLRRRLSHRLDLRR